MKKILLLLVLLVSVASTIRSTAQGTFWGMTTNSGGGNGTIFKTNADGSGITVVHRFIQQSEGTNPAYASLIKATNGKFYGLAHSGGSNLYGALFEFDPATDTYTKKFNGSIVDGGFAAGSLVQAGNGKLYGMARKGNGLNDLGVLFEFDPSTGTYTKKINFTGDNGASPHGTLTLADNGKLYGLTVDGGTNNIGVLFEYDPANGDYTKKHDFAGTTNGAKPLGSLTLVSNGKLYGLTLNGGSADKGILFEFDPANSTYTEKMEFTGANGANPIGDLSLAANGKLYGVTQSGGTEDKGVLFEFDPTNSVYTKKHDFQVATGSEPVHGPTQSGNGKLYGVTAHGGTLDGVMYEYDLATNTYTAITNFDSSDLGVNPQGKLLFVKADQTIAFGSLANKAFGDAAFNLTATSTSSLAVSYASSNTAVATISGNTVTIVGVGSTIITASQPGNASYHAAANVQQILTVNKGNQTITFGSLANKTFGNSPFNLTATASSGLAITYVSSNNAVATVSGNTVTIVGGGSTTITASQAGDAFYNAATSVQQPLTVNKANQTISFGVISSKTFGTAPFDLTAIATSALPVTYVSSNTSVATVSGVKVTVVGAGTTTITASQAGNSNFNAAPDVPRTLTVNKSSQTITFSALPSKTLFDSPFELNATASSNLAITYTSSNTNVATISGSTVTIVGLGTTTITASQAGNANVNAAPDVEQTLAVNKLRQAITFSAISGKTIANATFNLTATSSSNLAVSYTSSNTDVATISGNVVTILNTGTTIITALQPGDATYDAAIPVEQVLVVTTTQTPVPGELWGMTYAGGEGSGIIFKTNADGTDYATKLSFSASHVGHGPVGGLTLAENGKFYGMTNEGGTNNLGVLFEYDPATDAYAVKLEFTGYEGDVPGADHKGTLVSVGGKLYGMTSHGGENGQGVLFEYEPIANTYIRKFSFSDESGYHPFGSLALANGKLYGTTGYGGANGMGTLFEYDPATSTCINKLDFDGDRGSQPLGTLTWTNGKLYGTTKYGGVYDLGVIFEYDPVNSAYSKRVDFTGTDGLAIGKYPAYGGFTLASNNKLYGLTFVGGANDLGVLFEYDPVTNTYVNKIDFTGTTGSAPGRAPHGSLTLSSNGKLYGMTVEGGVNDKGVFFEYDPFTNAYAKKHDFTGASGQGSLPFGDLLFVKASQSISFEPLTPKTFGEPSFNVTATASSSLPVTYTSSNTSVATVSGNTITIVGAGSTTITASQSGDHRYKAATNAHQTLTVNKTSQTISFGTLPSKTFGDAAFELTATASSNLPVSYASSNTGVATIIGTSVAIVGVGTCTITASQAGNASFNAAPSTQQTLTVGKANQTISFPAVADKTLGDAPFALSATASSNLAVGFASTSPKITIAGNQVTLVSGGRVTVSATQTGDANYHAATPVERSFCIKPVKPAITLSNSNSESPTLASNAASGNQWFLNGTAIPGANNTTLSVAQAGVYKVQVTVDDCNSDFSNDQVMLVTGDESSFNSHVEIFPNPTADWLYVKLGDGAGKKSVKVFQPNGIETESLETTGSEVKLNVVDYRPGLYLLKVKTDHAYTVVKFVKQ